MVTSIALIPRPTPLPGDVTGWLETFAERFSSVLPRASARRSLAEVQDALRPDLCDDEGAGRPTTWRSLRGDEARCLTPFTPVAAPSSWGRPSVISNHGAFEPVKMWRDG